MNKRVFGPVVMVVAAALCVGLAIFLNGEAAPTPAPAAGEDGIYTPGVYTASAMGYGGDVTVELTVDANAVTDVKLIGDKETPAIGGAALEDLGAQIMEAQSAEIDGVSGATFTSTAVKDAAADALSQAQG